MPNRKQFIVFLFLLITYALSAFLTYSFFAESLATSLNTDMPDLGVPPVILGLANAGIVLVLYGILGLIGLWFARKLSLPGVFSPNGNLRRWFWIPLILGLICGIILVALDILFAPFNGLGYITHPPFPVSILASISAGIGEEIAFRVFVFGLWGVMLNWIFGRFQRRKIVLWVANLIAALVFSGAHLGTAMLLTESTTIMGLNPILIAEILILNTLVGLVAGERYIQDGLLAAAGVHFWTDVVFHVVWGVLGNLR